LHLESQGGKEKLQAGDWRVETMNSKFLQATMRPPMNPPEAEWNSVSGGMALIGSSGSIGADAADSADCSDPRCAA